MWNSPITWVAGEVVTAAQFNENIRDDLRYIKGLDGAVEIEDDLTVPNLITAGNVDGVNVSAHASGTAMAGHAAGIGTHSHSASAADGGQISASVITGRFTLDNMPTGTDGYYLKGTGTGSSPAYSALAVNSVSSISATSSMLSTSNATVMYSALVPSTAKNIYAVAYMQSNLAASCNITYNYNSSTEDSASGQIFDTQTFFLSGTYPGKGISASFDFIYKQHVGANARCSAFLFYDYIS